MGVEKVYFPIYQQFLLENADLSEITGTVDYYAYFRFQAGDQDYTTTQLLNLDRFSILRVTTSGNVKTYEWANGQWNGFNVNWNDRATHNYHLRRWD